MKTYRFFRFIALAAVSGALAACGAGGQSGTSAIPAVDTTQQQLSTMSIVSRGPNNSITLTGSVVALLSNGFQIQGGPGVGYLHVITTSATKYTGRRPFLRESVRIIGTGTPATSVTAASVEELATPVNSPAPFPTAQPASASEPARTMFMPSSWGKISAMQVFDDTSHGYVPQAAAAADGWRYSAIWGARNNIGTAWLASNAALQTGYYNALETDESPTGWGAIGHTLTWWQGHHPDWVLYACTASGAVTRTPSWVPGLNNVPLDVHNPAVVDYQVRLMANYAHRMGYRALAIDETTFWQADSGAGSGSYGCGIYQRGSFVRRYRGTTDPNWAADVVAWVKIAHSILKNDPTISQYHLALMVNHPHNQLSSQEQQLLANVDADLDETGYINYGRPTNNSASSFVETTNWAKYAQQHGVAVMMNQNWGRVSVGTAELDYSIASYLMGNQQAESVFVSPAAGYGTEQWHSQYGARIGAPCGDYYSAGDASNPSVYYRRFANAIVVVNAGSGGRTEVAHLPSGHTYADLFGRRVTSSLTLPSNNGYVLLTGNGCH